MFVPGPQLKAGLFFALILSTMGVLGWLMSPVIIPLLLSSVLYVLLEPLVSLLQRKGMSRVVAIGALLVAMLGLAAWLIVVAMPVLAEQFGLLRERLPAAWDDISARIQQLETWFSASLGVTMEGGLLIKRISAVLEGWSGQAVSVISTWFANLALWLVLVPLIAFFLLRDYRSLRNLLIGMTPNRNFESTLAIYHRVAHQLQAYVRGVMVQSGVMAVVTGTGFLLIGLPMAPVLGIVAGILNLIPYVGPMLGLVAPLLVALTAGAGVDVYAGLLLVMLAAQLIDNLVVIPAVVARAADIHPLVALLGVIIAGNLFGLMGMVFAIPIVSSSRIIYGGLLAGVERRPLL